MDFAIKKKLYEQQAAAADSPDDAAKYLALLKTLNEIEKFDADVKKIQAETVKVNADINNISYTKQTDWIRFIGLLAPMVTSVILIITLMIQTSQTKENRLAQKQEKEDEKWKLLTDKLSGPDAPVNETIPALIKEFYKSDRYKNTAVELSTNFLSIVKSEDTFNSLFKDYVQTIDHDNYSYLVRLSRKLISQFSAAQVQTSDDNKMLARYATDSAKSAAPGAKAYYEQKIADDSAAVGRATTKLVTTSVALATFIKRFTKNNQSVAATAPLDLSNAYIYMTNLDSVDFTGVILNGAEFDRVTFAHAKLIKVKKPEATVFTDSAWWLADEISPDFLNHLIKFPYYSGSDLLQPSNSEVLYNTWLKEAEKNFK